MYLPLDVAKQALDAAGVDHQISDLQGGSRAEEICLRNYLPCLEAIFRSAKWNFATKRSVPLVLLADSTGRTLNVDRAVPLPWRYSYEYPIDCVMLRSIPLNAIQPAPAGTLVPPTTGYQPGYYRRDMRSARFEIAADSNHPAASIYTSDTPGVSAGGRTVVLTDAPNAIADYTAMIPYPSQWDPLFRQAFVAHYASFLALPLSSDKKVGMAMRNSQIAIARDLIEKARVANGNEDPMSSDLPVDWINVRIGGYRDSFGRVERGFDSVAFADGSVI